MDISHTGEGEVSPPTICPDGGAWPDVCLDYWHQGGCIPSWHWYQESLPGAMLYSSKDPLLYNTTLRKKRQKLTYLWYQPAPIVLTTAKQWLVYLYNGARSTYDDWFPDELVCAYLPHRVHPVNDCGIWSDAQLLAQHWVFAPRLMCPGIDQSDDGGDGQSWF